MTTYKITYFQPFYWSVSCLRCAGGECTPMNERINSPRRFTDICMMSINQWGGLVHLLIGSRDRQMESNYTWFENALHLAFATILEKHHWKLKEKSNVAAENVVEVYALAVISIFAINDAYVAGPKVSRFERELVVGRSIRAIHNAIRSVRQLIFVFFESTCSKCELIFCFLPCCAMRHFKKT